MDYLFQPIPLLPPLEVKINDFHDHHAAKEFIAGVLAGEEMTLEKME